MITQKIREYLIDEDDDIIKRNKEFYFLQNKNKFKFEVGNEIILIKIL